MPPRDAATSAVTSLPEVGGDAALWVPPDDPAALALQLSRVVNEPALANHLRERGFARASTMTWQRSTAALVDVFERTVRTYPETRASRVSRLFTR